MRINFIDCLYRGFRHRQFPSMWEVLFITKTVCYLLFLRISLIVLNLEGNKNKYS